MSDEPLEVAGTIAIYYGTLEIDGDDTPVIELAWPTPDGADSIILHELTGIRLARAILDQHTSSGLGRGYSINTSRLTNLGKTK